MSEIEVTIKQSLDHVINGEIVREYGTFDYNELENKPSINGVELVGNKTTADLGIEIDTSNLATKEDLEEYAKTEDIPTKTSELENDNNFIDGNLLTQVTDILLQELETTKGDVKTLNDKVDNLPTGGTEYTAGVGIDITDSVISANTNIQIKGIFNYSTTYKAGEIVKYHIDDTDGYQYFISLQGNNKGRYPRDYNNDYWAVLNNTTQLTYIENHTDIPICMISSGGTSGNTPNAWRIIVPSNTTNLANMPTINSTTGLMKVPSGIDGYYTKDEVDALVGDLGTILDGINGEII